MVRASCLHPLVSASGLHPLAVRVSCQAPLVVPASYLRLLRAPAGVACLVEGGVGIDPAISAAARWRLARTLYRGRSAPAAGSRSGTGGWSDARGIVAGEPAGLCPASSPSATSRSGARGPARVGAAAGPTPLRGEWSGESMSET